MISQQQKNDTDIAISTELCRGIYFRANRRSALILPLTEAVKAEYRQQA